MHDALGHGGNFAHEGFAAEFALLDLGEFVFPLACELGFAQFNDLQAVEQGDELEGFGGGDEFAPFAQQVFFSQQPFNDGGAGGRRAQAFFLHGFAQFVIFDGFACAFHRAQQGSFAKAGGGLGFEVFGLGVLGAHHFARLYGD